MCWDKSLILLSVSMFARCMWVSHSSVGSEILFNETWLDQEDPFKQIWVSKEDKEEWGLCSSLYLIKPFLPFRALEWQRSCQCKNLMALVNAREKVFSCPPLLFGFISLKSWFPREFLRNFHFHSTKGEASWESFIYWLKKLQMIC